jgi:predicted NodU family carbamoyl transferase
MTEIDRNRPEDAIHCFLRTGIDALLIGDHLLVKNTEIGAP